MGVGGRISNVFGDVSKLMKIKLPYKEKVLTSRVTVSF
jgi:hypothetical protein